LAKDYDVTATSIAALATMLPASLRILDTDAESRLSERLGGSPGYVRSLYVPGKPNGQALDASGVLNVDLEEMPFPDCRLDIVLTSEVMGHVRHVDKAHQEIARCLRPGGTYLFTVPYDDSLDETWRLIDPETDEPLVDLPHIHGDPLRSEGIKSYRVFGRDIVHDLARVGFEAEFQRVDRPDVGIYGGDAFVARRLQARR
jgi:SAM-dependent methyltransferase